MNQSLPKDLHLFKKPGRAPFGGARAARRRSSRSATAHTRAPASGRKRWNSPRQKPSRGAVASTRRTARSAMAVTAICREMSNRYIVKRKKRQPNKKIIPWIQWEPKALKPANSRTRFPRKFSMPAKSLERHAKKRRNQKSSERCWI